MNANDPKFLVFRTKQKPKQSNLSRLIKALKGGPGSGHRGHAGRPGQRGGGAPGSGGGSEISAKPLPDKLRLLAVLADNLRESTTTFGIAGNRLFVADGNKPHKKLAAENGLTDEGDFAARGFVSKLSEEYGGGPILVIYGQGNADKVMPKYDKLLRKVGVEGYAPIYISDDAGFSAEKLKSMHLKQVLYSIFHI